jgi:hypothetical protein
MIDLECKGYFPSTLTLKLSKILGYYKMHFQPRGIN